MDSLTVTKLFLDHYHRQGCKLTPDSGILPPLTDESTLFVSSGMQPLKRYYTGYTDPPGHQLTGMQTCVRSTDLESVGVTNRHLTSFTMLGHFGWHLPSYDEPIRSGWQLLTEVYGLDPDRLHVTWYGGGVVGPDETTRDIWMEILGGESRLHPGSEDNFWRMGQTGPCGPCTEIFYRLHERPCSIGCSPTTCGCDRWLEIYNLVLTQYEQLTDSPHSLRLIGKHLDTGLGLERLCMVLQGVDCVQRTDVYDGWWQWLEGVEPSRSSLLIVDHLQTIRRLQEVGIVPGNRGREYLLRQLIRRTVHEGDKLELDLGRIGGFEEEQTRYRKMLKRGERLVGKIGELDEDQVRFLHETHGIPPSVSWQLWNQLHGTRPNV